MNYITQKEFLDSKLFVFEKPNLLRNLRFKEKVIFILTLLLSAYKIGESRSVKSEIYIIKYRN